ncbi:hypothetical protein BDV33DRAFT_72387 [Aspergillus novoparasiticus]|uniref:Uncharacterized protein n=1 Tax=Aspergillus novoparasiticus TaxID=986946 RepID=A0A5N6EZ82_9EURO|nr:hypothetical protein BDV33DRAFT_72387 [Aspergillus novoparasiticus]
MVTFRTKHYRSCGILVSKPRQLEGGDHNLSASYKHHYAYQRRRIFFSIFLSHAMGVALRDSAFYLAYIYPDANKTDHLTHKHETIKDSLIQISKADSH